MAKDGSLIFDTKIDQKGFNKGVSALKSSAGIAGKAISASLIAASAAIIGIGAYSTKASIEFESAFAGVRKTVEGTEEDFKMLEKGIRDMSKRMPQSAAEIATVAEAAGQLGIKTDAILGFTETMVMLGDATNLSSEEAATALARLANITGMSQNDFDKLGSTIVALGNNLATTESEIVEMSLRLAGTGAQVGLTEAQILALSGAMSSVGINAEAGGSAFSRFMQKVNTAVLSGSDKLQGFAEIAGMSANEFSKSWKEKPEEAITAFVKGLEEVNKSGGDVTSVLKGLGIQSIQEVDTLLRLSGASDVLIESLGISADAWEENSALMSEAEQRYATAESKIAILKNNINDLAISIGDELKASLIDVIDTSTNMVERLSTAFEENGFEGLVEELGVVLADILNLIAENAPIILEGAVSLITNFIQGIQENLPQISESAIILIQTFITSFLEILPEVLVLGIELIANLVTGIAEMLPELIPIAISAIDTIINALMENLPLIIDSGVQIILALAEGIANNLPALMTQAIDLVILIADKIIENLPLIINAALKIIMALAQGIIDNLPKLIAEVPRIINSFADAIYGMLPTIIATGVKIIVALIKGLIQSIPTLVANIPAIILAIVNVFTLYNWWNLGKGVILKIKDGILAMKSNIASTARNLARGVINAIKNLFSSGGGVGRNFISKIANGIRGMASSIASTARNLARGAVNAIKNTFSNVGSIGKNLVKGIWNGINNAKGWVLSKIKGFGSSIVKGIKNIFGIKSPSTIMRDEVGENLTLGIGVGLEKGMPNLQRDVNDEMSKLTRKMKATVDVESSSVGNKITASSESNKYNRNNDNILGKIKDEINKINPNGDNKPVIKVYLGNEEFNDYIVETANTGLQERKNDSARARGIRK